MSEAGRPVAAGYPVNLVVAGRRVVVVGGGPVATRKVRGLLDAGAEVTVVAPTVTDELRGHADTGRITVVQRPFEPSDLDGAWLAFAATADATVNEAVYRAGEARDAWVNAADDPSRCSFTLMSVVRRADLVVAIGTNGRSPALAAHLRRRCEEEFGPEYGTLLDLLADVREEWRRAGRSTEDADWQRAFSSGIVDLVRDGRVADAKELLRTCL